jgi:NAD+ diphosphatase
VFERLAGRRDDAEWIAATLERDDIWLVPLAGGASLVAQAGTTSRAVIVRRGERPALADDARELVLLGEWQGVPCFAAVLEAPLPWQGAEFVELRRVLTLLADDELELLAYARAFGHWHATHRHCGACGARTAPARAGHARVCGGCAREIFPRIDPAVIVLVADAERCLLGHQAAWGAGRYSTLAGFVEPGETLEEAVAREVFEETAVRIAAPAYRGSQPWPFPSSLMLGFEAAPVTLTIAVDGAELQDARWFTRAEIAAEVAGGTLRLSPRRSISWRLLADWYDRGGGRLADLPGAEGA